ncbi:247_t:CDS:2 [Dentiscutata erythropus]|uniref:247_t:CDS:1 n=1 Tax=Dentiscutata erythropus TaxID=1348616 RepID=A0A9N9DD82_9GLOM|nr:247_t:CDS:2 [Dentiscutata erythropus]
MPKHDKKDTPKPRSVLRYTDNSSSSISDGDNTPSCETRQHWQYAHRQVRAAIFLSLDELWTIPSEVALMVSIFDSQFKVFQWALNQLKNAKKSLEQFYNKIKAALELLNLNNFSKTAASSLSIHDNNDDDGFLIN